MADAAGLDAPGPVGDEWDVGADVQQGPLAPGDSLTITDGIDILAIPRDWAQEITVLEDIGTVINESEVDKCTIENLESQQE